MTTKELSPKLLKSSAVILALSLMFATSGLLISQSMAPTIYDVTILDFSFDPPGQCIEKGNTINWTNNDAVIYTLWFVYEENDSTYLLSDPIPPGESWSHVFNDPVKLRYHNFERVWITGRLRVVKVFGDINWDGTVDVRDLYALGRAYPTTPDNPDWNEDADINFDNTVNEADLTIVRSHYGEIDP